LDCNAIVGQYQELHEALQEARKRYTSVGRNSKVGREASAEIDVLEGEFHRRRLTIPVPKTDELKRPKKGGGA
jgi:hypothetical protein